MTDDEQARRELVATLDQLDTALADNIERSKEMRRRLRGFRRGIDRGRPVIELVIEETAPRTVEMLSANLFALETVGAALRVRLAHSLRAEGQTVERIGELYGVTRQRVSALLRQSVDI